MKRASVIGCGLIGQERIQAVKYIENNFNDKIKLISVFDINKEILNNIKSKYNVHIATNMNEIWETNPDWVFIVTPNDIVKDITKQAFKYNCNVVLEKPFGRTLQECEEIISLKPDNCKLQVGFNYRFFAGIEKAIQDVKSGKFGKLISVNIILAHGNSPGMDKSWKLDPIRCGGCITDLGVHVFDIILQLSKSKIDINCVKQWKGYWNTGIDEETHIMLSNQEGTIFNTQVSLNRWKSNFRLEINGTEGYGIVEGRGRSYGPQSYTTGIRWGWLSGKKQIDTEQIIINKYDCSDSFIKETLSIFGLTTNQYSDLPQACDYINGKNIMQLLDQAQRLLNV
jgi:predicted dehydrogenase